MSDFKIGDKVVVNGKYTGYSAARKEKEGIVVAIDHSCTFPYRIKYVNGGVESFSEKELDLVQEKPEYNKEEVPKKYDENKPMMHLVRPEFVKGLAEVLTQGHHKYSEERGEIPNYLRGGGFHYSKVYDSLQRHLNTWFSGDSIDEESGKNHLLHAAANIMFLYKYEISNKGVDDRYVLDKNKED